jgi:hypothetical protein
MSEIDDRNIERMTAEVEKLTEAIKQSKNREEHIQLTALANQANEFLNMFIEHSQIGKE